MAQGASVLSLWRVSFRNTARVKALQTESVSTKLQTSLKVSLPAGKDGGVHGPREKDPLEDAGPPLVEPEGCQDEGQEARNHREDEDVVSAFSLNA